MHRRNSFRCRRRADSGAASVALALALLSCASPATRTGTPADAGAASSADAGLAPDRDDSSRWDERYYQGYLAEILRGDIDSARAAFEEVIAGAGEGQPELAARAALRLADLETLADNRRKAIELVARAAVLGRADAAIVERADRMQTHLASLRSKGSEVRGPPAGTAPTGVSDAAAELFADAEGLLAAYHTLGLRPRLEDLRAGIRAKERAMDTANRAYRQVVALDEPRATVAAEFRTASLLHDLAMSLMFDLPPELEDREAAKLRRSLRGRAINYLRKARKAYQRSLDAGATIGDAASERWLVAASRGQRSVDDLLRGRGE